MITRFARVALNKRVYFRYFSSKDTDSLKERFNQMAKDHEEALSNLQNNKQAEIRTKDQSKMTESLKSQFKSVQDDLSRNTGEAKTVYQRMKESYSNFSVSDIKLPEWGRSKAPKHPSQEQESSEDPKDSVASEQSKQDQSSHKFEANESIGSEQSTQETQDTTEKETQDTTAKETPPKPTWKETYPKLAPYLSYSESARDYLKDALKETFNQKQYKKDKYIENHLRMKRDLERMEAMGEVPEWKRGALQVVEQKPTRWRQAKDKILDSKLGTILYGSRASLMRNESVKKVKEGYSDLKEGLNSISDDIKMQLEERNINFVSKTQEIAAKALMETAEAKALKQIRMYDSEFDVYDFEKELEDMVEDVYGRILMRDNDYLGQILSGQAKKYFDDKLKQIGEDNLANTSVSKFAIRKPTFLGVNIEDKMNPKFSYSISVTEAISTISGDSSRKARLSSSFNAYVVVMRNPDPDFEIVPHPWQIIVFQPDTNTKIS